MLLSIDDAITSGLNLLVLIKKGMRQGIIDRKNYMEKISLKKNFIMNAMLSMSQFAFSLVVFPYVSRVILPEGVGKVSFAAGVINYFNMFAQLGIPVYGIRACAQVRDDREKLSRCAHELLFISILTSIAAYAFLILSVCTVGKLKSESFLYLIVSFSIILNAVGFEWLYKGLEQYSYIAVRSAVLKAVSVILIFIYVKNPEDYIIYAVISIFASYSANIVNLFGASKYIDFRYLGKYDLKQHIKPVVVFFAMTCATQVYLNMDNLMLGFLKGDSEVGYYDIAVRIKNILVTVVTSLGAVLLPRMSYLVKNKDKTEFLRITKKALIYVAGFSFFTVVFFTVFAREGILLLAGRAFMPSVLSMKIIMPCVMLIGITNILGMQVLVPLGKEKLVLYSVIGGAVADFIINLVLIPQMGAAGAATGTLVAEFVVLVFQIAFIITLSKEKNMKRN